MLSVEVFCGIGNEAQFPELELSKLSRKLIQRHGR